VKVVPWCTCSNSYLLKVYCALYNIKLTFHSYSIKFALSRYNLWRVSTLKTCIRILEFVIENWLVLYFTFIFHSHCNWNAYKPCKKIYLLNRYRLFSHQNKKVSLNFILFNVVRDREKLLRALLSFRDRTPSALTVGLSSLYYMNII
jgi:hypothetical protein